MVTLSCADALPADVAGYQDDCILMNSTPLPRRSDDPHEGVKNVYACNVPLATLEAGDRPLPDGSIIIKESTREDASYPWLVATARKQNGKWRWNEYSRNFSDEEFLHILASESVCIDCHRRVQSADWIYTRYSRAD